MKPKTDLFDYSDFNHSWRMPGEKREAGRHRISCAGNYIRSDPDAVNE